MGCRSHPYIYPSPIELQALLDASADHWFHVYRPKAGDVVVEMGAGKGWDTLAFSRAVGPTDCVISIEANPGTFEYLDRLCRINNLENVVVINAAVLDKTGSVLIEDGSTDEANRVVTGEGGIRVGL